MVNLSSHAIDGQELQHDKLNFILLEIYTHQNDTFKKLVLMGERMCRKMLVFDFFS